MIEKSTKYATIVDTLPDAWAFVMAHVDLVGSDPQILITPIWRHGEEVTRHFEVAVSGMVELPQPETNEGGLSGGA